MPIPQITVQIMPPAASGQAALPYVPRPWYDRPEIIAFRILAALLIGGFAFLGFRLRGSSCSVKP